MSLDSDILTDLRQLLAEHGVKARWNNVDLLVLASRVRRDQQIDLGGFVDSLELSLRMPKLAFPQALPKSGERILVEEKPYPKSRNEFSRKRTQRTQRQEIRCN